MLRFLLFSTSESLQSKLRNGARMGAATITREFQWAWEKKNVRDNSPICIGGQFSKKKIARPSK